MSTKASGARFYDEHRRDRGWASLVVKRESALSHLVILEVTTTDPGLTGFLRALDRSPLRVRLEDGQEGSASYQFTWASGYENGSTVRVHGILQGA